MLKCLHELRLPTSRRKAILQDLGWVNCSAVTNLEFHAQFAAAPSSKRLEGRGVDGGIVEGDLHIRIICELGRVEKL
jgi:hypothetical protein